VMGWCRSGGTDLVVWLEVRGKVMGFRPKSQNRVVVAQFWLYR
jgi:hypothetical protein